MVFTAHCGQCFTGYRETFLSVSALTLHVEIAHRGMAKCHVCGEIRYCTLREGGRSSCTDQPACVRRRIMLNMALQGE